MKQILIQRGRVIDPASGFDQTADVLLSEGIIVDIGRINTEDATGEIEIIDAEGCIVSPGLIDLHVHFREPGYEYKESIRTGVASALNGGYTTVCCMPNTRPALDSPEQIAFIENQAAKAKGSRVFSVAAATVARSGERVGPLFSLAEAGAVAFSDDGDVIEDSRVMKNVFSRAKEVGRCFMQHCQDPSLSRGGVMNAGSLATRLGLTGWPRVAEETIIERDININRTIGCAYHIQHLSSGGSVEIVRKAQNDGQPVTCEASPHHLLLTEDACRSYNTNAKMNPPLRADSDVNAIKAGIADGTITILATDHAPHSMDEKAMDFTSAPFGIVGLDCALPLYAKALIESNVIDWVTMLGMMTANPARLTGLDRIGLGSLTVGGPGDITVIDPDLEWKIDVNEFASMGRNCPFDGWHVKGRAIATIVAGYLNHRREISRITTPA